MIVTPSLSLPPEWTLFFRFLKALTQLKIFDFKSPNELDNSFSNSDL